MEERLARVEESTKSAHKRVDRLEQLLETNNRLVTNVEVIATEMKAMREDVNKIDDRVNIIEEKPVKRYDSIIGTIITRNCNGSSGFFIG